MPPGYAPSASTRKFVRWIVQNGLWVWLCALLLGVPAAGRTWMLYRNLKSDVEELLPRDAPSVLALDELRGRMAGLRYLGVVVDVGAPENLPAGERFVDDLAVRIRSYPPGSVRAVRVGREEERSFFARHAALYVSQPDLVTVRERVESRRDYEVSRATGAALDDDDPPPTVDISDIQHKYDTAVATGTSRFSNAAQETTMLLVEVPDSHAGGEGPRALLSRVKADVATLGGPARYAPGMRIGYAGDVAINVEETQALEADLSLSSVLVVFAVCAAIVAYYRWPKSIVVLLPPLLLAVVYAFGIASLWPISIHELNSNTAFLASIIVGNGINVGLVLLARYREERLRGSSVEDALVVGVRGARTGTFAAAAAAGVAYASLSLTEFRGFRQFGFIGGIGMLASWVTAFVLVPPLLAWVDRSPPVVKPSRPTLMGFVVGWVQRFPVPIVAAAMVLTAVCIVKVSRFDSSQVESDFGKLRRADTWTNGEGYWGRRMDAVLGRYLTPTVLLFDSRDVATKLGTDLRAAASGGTLRESVASIRTLDDVVPADQPAKLAELARIRDALTPRVRAAMDPDRLAKLDELLGDDRPIGAGDVPPSLLVGLREQDGELGRTVLVFPRINGGLWRAQAIHAYVSTLRADAGSAAPPGRVAGSLPISSDILDSIARDAPRASVASFLGVVFVVVLALRARRASFYVIGSLVVGVLWLAGISMMLGIKLNFSNFVAYPITFGIGVDYSVNVMTRYVQDGARDVEGAVRSTGGAVALCSLTTIIGYSSLLLAENRALFLFGELAVLGEIACLTAAVIVLPAVLLLLSRSRLASMPEPSTSPR